MKKLNFFKSNLLFVLILAFVLLLTSCAASNGGSADMMGGAMEGGSYAPAPGGSGKHEGAGDGEVTEPGEEDDTVSNIQSGQLTACAYDDNEHFEFWKGLLSTNQEGNGPFKLYYENSPFQTFNRIKITVPKEVPTKVTLFAGEEVLASSYTDAAGVAYLYPRTKQEEYKVKLEYYIEGSTELHVQEDTITGDTDYTFEGVSKVQDAIQIMFVIDTTGSMGDELEYIKTEVVDIMERVEEAFPSSHLELAVMVYRDITDKYITKYSDFTTDFNSQKQFLMNESASGGGDFEEAVQTALTEAAQKQWSENTKTKLLFHIADAPAHNEDLSTWNSAAHSLAAKGVKIITVASSGIDKKTEYLFRSQSLITNGQYVYLTNDSGIGGDHLEATVEERPVVEYLNLCLVRLIKGYHTGTFEEPIPYRQPVEGQ